MIEDLLFIIQLIHDVAEAAHEGAEIIADLQAAYDVLFGIGDPQYTDMDLDSKTLLLKRCTKIVANLDLDLACYPLGYTTAILFDLDGNPVP